MTKSAHYGHIIKHLEQSAKARAAADLLEREITSDAEKIIAKFIAE